jgi:hypothetical protein
MSRLLLVVLRVLPRLDAEAVTVVVVDTFVATTRETGRFRVAEDGAVKITVVVVGALWHLDQELVRQETSADVIAVMRATRVRRPEIRLLDVRPLVGRRHRKLAEAVLQKILEILGELALLVLRGAHFQPSVERILLLRWHIVLTKVCVVNSICATRG